MIVLDLFCGTKSLKKVLKPNYTYIGLDIESKHNPEILADFLEWDYKSVNPDIIWASPDCSIYSMASGSYHLGKDRKPKSEKGKLHLKILQKLKECINYHLERNPNLLYFIENPTARMVWFLTEYPRYDVSYCQYGCDRMKPTTIWTNKKGFIPKKCKRNNPDCHHLRAPRGTQQGTQKLKKIQKYVIPEQLLMDLLY